MKMIFKIAKTELQTLFYSPVAWLILIIFTFQASILFTNVFDMSVKSQSLEYQLDNVTLFTFGGMFGLFSGIQQYLYLYIPLLTMGLMSRELSSGSIKLLYSSPVTNKQIVLGKYLAMMLYGLLLMAILSIFVIYSAFAIKSFDFLCLGRITRALLVNLCLFRHWIIHVKFNLLSGCFCHGNSGNSGGLELSARSMARHGSCS